MAGIDGSRSNSSWQLPTFINTATAVQSDAEFRDHHTNSLPARQAKLHYMFGYSK